jgi:hypothetical protein
LIDAPYTPPPVPFVRKDRRGCRPATCIQCGCTFPARADRPAQYCGRECFHKASAGKGISGLPRYIHHSDDAAKKIRANGLINRRIKLGIITRPKQCELCGKVGKVDACHHDYDKPDVVTFACRQCHARSHYNREVEARLIARARSRGGPVQRKPFHPLKAS